MKTKTSCGLYVILDRETLGKRNFKKTARKIIKTKPDIIQLRDKISSDKMMLNDARYLATLARKNKIEFIVNDRLHIALLSGSSGVHLGQRDLPIGFARKVLGKKRIIGISASSQKDALCAQKKGADYVACGAIFKSITKADSKVVGLDLLKKIKDVLRKTPLVAIGGIKKDNLRNVLDKGADIIAVASAIICQKDIESAISDFKNILNTKR